MKKTYSVIIKQLLENGRFKTPMRRKLSHSSKIKNDALMHREGLKGCKS